MTKDKFHYYHERVLKDYPMLYGRYKARCALEREQEQKPLSQLKDINGKRTPPPKRESILSRLLRKLVSLREWLRMK